MSPVDRIGCIAELWRYPVKSMRGEQLQMAAFDAAGIVGDRRFAVESTAAPQGKPLVTSRERTAMLLWQPRLDPVPEVIAPDGRRFALPSPALVAALQEALAAPDAELGLRHSPETPLTDVRPLSLVSAATLHRLKQSFAQPLDPQRFRSNLVLALADDRPFAEDALAGATLQFGAAGPRLRVQERIPRCRIVSLDPYTAEADPGVLRHLAQLHEGRMCVYARVLRQGELSVGEDVFLCDSGKRGLDNA